MASAYSIGKRIALDYFEQDILQMDVIKKELDFIKKICGEDVPISTHFIQTKESGWGAVIKLDNFFANTQLVKTKEEFVKILMEDRNLKGIDIAKYILTKVPCTHLKLEKLVYLCYADYLCEYKSKLFEDTIYAYKLGPVVKTVYGRYKKSGSDFLFVEDDTITYEEKAKEMPIRSRVLAAKDGLKKLISIDKTLAKYAKYSASDLVNLTHRKSSPWEKAGSGDLSNAEITDDLILKYHKYEEV